METLWAVVQSLKQSAEIAGVQLVTGDTKVVDRGKGDGVFINTAGVGIVEHGVDDRSRPACGRATWCCSAATLAVTALPSWPCARGWSSSRRLKATALR